MNRRALSLLLVALIAGTGAAAQDDTGEAPDDAGQEAAGIRSVEPGDDAVQSEATGDAAESTEAPDKEPLLDRTQRTVNNLVVGTAQRVDNVFGSAGVGEEASVTRGRLSVGGQHDQRDGFRSRVRLRARYQLPALKNRTTLIFGRGDANDLVDGSGDDNIDTLPNRFNDFDDEDWLLGIGFSRDAALRRGWSFGAGVKLATPLEPYVRATYRRNRTYGERWLWRVEPRLFLQSQRGAGVSLQNTVDYAASESWLWRSWSIGVIEDDVEGLSWTSKLIAYQSLDRKSAFSYAVYGSGETDYEVPIRDYGIELRYRRQIAREWLFIELLGRVNWPRDFIVEQREQNLGVGIEFELQFGDWPGRNRDPEPPMEGRVGAAVPGPQRMSAAMSRTGMTFDR
jgi:hypothetical protein